MKQRAKSAVTVKHSEDFRLRFGAIVRATAEFKPANAIRSGLSRADRGPRSHRPSDGRVSLGWAPANSDETVFDAPEEVRLDRKPYPYISFGFGTHLCLGAPHARLIVRCLLQALTARVGRITVLEATEHIEKEERYQRSNGFESLAVKLAPVK